MSDFLRFLLGLAVMLCLCFPALSQPGDALQGAVMDPSGAVIPGASVSVKGVPAGASQTTRSDDAGHYRFKGLAPGQYRVTSTAPGFQKTVVEVTVKGSERVQTLDLHLSIATQSQRVVVQGSAPQLEVAPDSNASAVVVSGKNLDALSNDPDELQSQLQELAGPSVGPNGGEIYIDGFTGGDLPPKSAIRSIRVNSNPFSVQNDRLGYGRIDILTKPGAASYHGSASAQYNDASMNAPSKFLAGSGQPLPAYHTWLMDANVGGPLGKNASFYFAMQRRNINRANLINTDVLDSNLNIVPYVASVNNPRTLTNVNPRVDFQLGTKNTLTVNYEYFEIGEKNDGVDTQSLPSTAYDTARSHRDLQLMDNQILSANAVNQVNFQLLHFHNSQTPLNTAPAVDVLGAFLGGGSDQGLDQRYETHYEFQDYATLTRGKHLLQFGGFIRDIRRQEDANANFNGTFTFNTLADYQQTQQALSNGQTMAQIQAAGFGPSQFNITAGILGAFVNRLDVAFFAGDDWKLSSRFTASYGLRFETQNAISDHADWAPRVGIAWALGSGANPKTVVRAGWGMFYERFDDDQMINAERLNGTNQTTYIVNSPMFYPDVPPPSSLASANQSLPTTYRISPHLRSPYDMDLAASVERQVTRDATASFTYLYARGNRRFLSNDINAPLPGTYADDPASGTRPLGDAAGNVYEYESAGIFRQTQLIANVDVSAGDRLSVFGYYGLNHSHSNSRGADYFASNPWNLMQDYGRAAFDIRHRGTIGGTMALPLALRLSSMLMASSGRPFSILLPQDLYGTGIRNARPSLATSATPPANTAVTRYGSFDLAPPPTAVPIAPNTASGPANVILNLQASRTFGFGGEGAKAHGGEGTAAGGQQQPHHRGPGGLGGRGLGGGGGFGLGGATDRRFALTVSVSALNALNTVNLAPPVSTLGSPNFGRSMSLAGGPYSAQVGNPVANRLVNVGLAFSF
ncbi:MAG TPA: carboxypeptidase regulatory-like domain-containing protein [Terracidiphilus sp.]